MLLHPIRPQLLSNLYISKIKCNYILFDSQSLPKQKYISNFKCNYILFNSNHFPNVNTSKIKCYLTSNCFPINIHQKLSVITSYLNHNHFLNENISKINCNYVLFDSNYFPNENTSKIKCY